MFLEFPRLAKFKSVSKEVAWQRPVVKTSNWASWPSSAKRSFGESSISIKVGVARRLIKTLNLIDTRNVTFEKLESKIFDWKFYNIRNLYLFRCAEIFEIIFVTVRPTVTGFLVWVDYYFASFLFGTHFERRWRSVWPSKFSLRRI